MRPEDASFLQVGEEEDEEDEETKNMRTVEGLPAKTSSSYTVDKGLLLVHILHDPPIPPHPSFLSFPMPIVNYAHLIDIPRYSQLSLL